MSDTLPSQPPATAPPTTHPRFARLLAFLPLFVIAVTATAMLRWTWLKWTDPIIDFGREAYVPWQLLGGRVLYRDIAYHNGPFSPYLNLVWFKLFGVSLHTLFFCNLVVAVATAGLLFVMVRRMADAFTATAATLAFVLLFAFQILTGTGNYNWIAPYSHEMTHGIAMSLLAIHFCGRACGGGRPIWSGASGVMLGLVFLTKGEVFAAATVAVVAQAVAARCSSADAGAVPWSRVGWWAAGLVAPPVIALAALLLAMPMADALQGVIGTWAYVFMASNTEQKFFLTLSGMDAPGRNVRIMAWWSVVYFMVLFTCFQLDRWAGRGRIRFAFAAVVSMLLLLFLTWLPRVPAWQELFAGLPVLLAMACLHMLLVIVRKRRRRQAAVWAVHGVGMLVFAAALLLKMLLRVRLHHYGFGLAMPAVAMFIVVTVAWLPQLARNTGGSGLIMRSAACAVWMAIGITFLSFQTLPVGQMTHVVGAGADQFYANRLGLDIERARQELSAATEPGQTLVTMPDCEMLNFLTRRTNPTRFGNFVPHQLQIFGESAMIEEFERVPPDFVALVHRDTTEYGPQFFGADYAQKLHAHIMEHYLPWKLIGPMPFTGHEGGVLILTRRGQ